MVLSISPPDEHLEEFHPLAIALDPNLVLKEHNRLLPVRSIMGNGCLNTRHKASGM